MILLKPKDHDTNLYDSDNGKNLKTLRAVDVSNELPPSRSPLILLYVKAVKGPIVQLVHGCSRVHYFLQHLPYQDREDSALSDFARYAKTTRAHLIELCLKHVL
jgi:hypothetical protein